MINGEKWLDKGIQCELEVVPCSGYSHSSSYMLPIKPSPNLPNLQSILLYPSLCYFEGTNVSVGRGTKKQFQIVGSPVVSEKNFSFTPVPMEGAKYPKHEGKQCFGDDLSNLEISHLLQTKKIDYQYVVEYYNQYKEAGKDFFLKTNFFDKLAGTTRLKEMVVDGYSADQISKAFADEAKVFNREVRRKYLLYTDF